MSAPSRIDLTLTLGPLRRGTGDPTMRISSGEVWRASRTPDGAVTVRLTQADHGIEVEAWGPGAGWLLEHAPAWCGALDDPSGFDPPAGLVRTLHRRLPGLRIPSTGLITERLIPVVLEQKVTGPAARRAYRRLVTALGEAFVFLSGVKNALEMDRRVHAEAVPPAPEEQVALARRLGYEEYPRQSFIDDYLRITRRARRAMLRVFREVEG